jgi:hypothetical protein
MLVAGLRVGNFASHAAFARRSRCRASDSSHPAKASRKNAVRSSWRSASQSNVAHHSTKVRLPVDHRRHAQGGAEIRVCSGGSLAKSIGLCALGVRQRQQFLPPAHIIVEDIAHGPHRIARLAGFDLAFAGAVDPDRIVVEIADDGPDLVRRSARRSCCNSFLPRLCSTCDVRALRLGNRAFIRHPIPAMEH